MAGGRQISENKKGLPRRWRFMHGAYFYSVPPGQECMWDGKKTFHLGRGLPEAFRKWAARMEQPGKIHTVSDLLERYLLEVIPKKAPKTQIENARHVRSLMAAFGSAHLYEIRPRDIYRYVDARSAKTAARREIEVLSHAFTKAIEWGLIDNHPFKGQIRLEGETPRDRYVEDWEVIEALSLSAPQKRGRRQGPAGLYQAEAPDRPFTWGYASPAAGCEFPGRWHSGAVS
uniref:Core-binding (CB) domain-containing protein n=1 Tax=Candidatus Kentrum sp. TUN TaxID=2126343 RepID=A0A451ACX8_9GAMM|nr:MAG: hypothetical protein BECKTUN1418D_GA0071000_12304 [Candidatus Kentron sp. TUN]